MSFLLVKNHMHRKCPGHYLADETGWIFAAVLLACFKISPGDGGLDAVDSTYPREGITMYVNMQLNFADG